MTNEQAIAILKDIDSRYPCSLESTFKDECERIALNMAVQALNTQESLVTKAVQAIDQFGNSIDGYYDPSRELFFSRYGIVDVAVLKAKKYTIVEDCTELHKES